MQNIIVYGAGGHAKAVIDTIEKANAYHIVGVLDGNKQAGTSFYGYKVLGNESWLVANSELVSSGIVAIGDNWIRSCIAAKISEINPQFKFINAIHPSSSIARGAVIGQGTVIMSGCTVNSDTFIGNHSIMYTHSSVDHDSSIGSFVSFAPQACTGGNVKIGDFTAISIGAAIIHGISIGEHTLIGAGSTVLSDIPSQIVAYGSPAKKIRAREIGDRYL